MGTGQLRIPATAGRWQGLTTPADLVREARCVYVERGKTCHEPAVGELKVRTMDNAPSPMCERHIQPEMHPPDLHRKLVRW
jgi:hypothetical protein